MAKEKSCKCPRCMDAFETGAFVTAIVRLRKERAALLAAIDAYFEAQKNRSVTAKEDDALRKAASLARSGKESA